jgi:L-ascorbate metabolism protein UlaG (beta-lactamase superfamily)
LAKVRWHGHACFEVSSAGVTVVTDPHDGLSLGLPAPKASADAVLISHDHFDHANGSRLVSKPDAAVVKGPGVHEVKGVEVKGVASFHDDSGGSKRGPNTIYVFELDGIRFCHLGDLGHPLTPSQVAEVGKVDVLFVPVGGVFTVDADAAWRVVEQLKPRLVVPMHFKVPGLKLGIAGVEPFLKGRPNVKRLDASELEVSREGLPAETTIVVLTPPRP